VVRMLTRTPVRIVCVVTACSVIAVAVDGRADATAWMSQAAGLRACLSAQATTPETPLLADEGVAAAGEEPFDQILSDETPSLAPDGDMTTRARVQLDEALADLQAAVVAEAVAHQQVLDTQRVLAAVSEPTPRTDARLNKGAVIRFIAGSAETANGGPPPRDGMSVTSSAKGSSKGTWRGSWSLTNVEISRTEQGEAYDAQEATAAECAHREAVEVLEYATARREMLESQAVTAEVRLAVLTAQSTTGAIFPVVGPVLYRDTWGDARGEGRHHQGVDFIAAWGSPIIAVEGGTVARLGWNDRGGWRVSINGSSGTYYYYAHMAAYPQDLYQGARVATGQVIGWIGDTGNATGVPHLHFEVHPEAGPAINPFAFVVSLQTAGPSLTLPPLPLDPRSRRNLMHGEDATPPRVAARYGSG